MAAEVSSVEAPRRSVQWRCPACLKPNDTEATGVGSGPWKCTSCGEVQPAQPETVTVEGHLMGCPRCGCPDLYRQRDFNRRLGVGLIVVGAVLAPFTHYISLPVFAGIDFLIYYLVPDVVICYHCQAAIRGYPGTKEIAAFDLNISDKYIVVERERGW
jgi:hypothetical protein